VSVRAAVALPALAMALATALAGCGLKGPLYLPEKSGGVVVRPGPGAAAPPAPAPGASTEPLPASQVPEEDSASQPEVPDQPETAPPPPGNGDG
jgi:hypothetical protein